MKDVAYLLSDDPAEARWLDVYFAHLRNALDPRPERVESDARHDFQHRCMLEDARPSSTVGLTIRFCGDAAAPHGLLGTILRPHVRSNPR